MTIRIRAILVIILTNLLITIFSVSTGIIFVQRNMALSTESDLAVMAQIADHLLGIELDFLKLKASGTAKSLETRDETEWPEIFSQQSLLYPDFIGMAVIDSEGTLVASFGDRPAEPGIIHYENMHQAFPPVYRVSPIGRPINTGSIGRSVFSSTVQTTDGVVFYLAVPLLFTHDRILVATLPGDFFSQLFSDFVIWETGHIFMSDSDGFAIANPREHWVQERFNYIQIAETDDTYADLAKTVTRMTLGEIGTGYYSVAGVSRVSTFRPISRSEEGWSIGVVAPLPESPTKNTDRGLLVVAVISIILNIIAATIASNFIKKPFEKIAILKEQADAASKAKSTFLSTMSHEIRTPMNAILGVSEIQLQKESLDPSVREAFLQIFTSGDLLLSIINDILDLSKIEAGKLELLVDEYEVASMISDTTQLNMMRIGSKPIKFELNIDENLPARLLGDELRIKQILNNLLSNAFKYTKEGSVILSIHAEPVNDSEVVIIFSVKDSGQGMTEEQVARIFDVYAQFNKKQNRATEGTGLGMSITHNLIKLMNGNIRIESLPDVGSTFIVILPQAKCTEVVLGLEAAENLEQFHMRRRDMVDKVNMPRDPMPYGNILVVDDVEANIFVARGLLALYEVKISSANSGIAAIEKVKSGEKYDIIFMDHMMPEMDGMEATKRLRDMGYKEPIIALSANAIEGQEAIFLKNGFDDFISKPIDLRHLNLLLNKYVRDKQPQEVIEEARRQKKEKQDIRVVQINLNSSVLESYVKDAADALETLESIGKKTIQTAGTEQDFLPEYSAALNKLHAVLEKLKTKRDEGSKGLGRTESETSEPADTQESLLKGKEVVGLDIPKGVERFAGNEQAYLDVLRAYAAGVSSMLDEIVAVGENTLDSYKIKVHGIKGTSYDVFAEQIAKDALDLENAAKAGNYQFIKENNEAFIENAAALVSRINDMLKSLESGKQKPLKDRPDQKVLAKLLAACNDYDMDGTDAAMAELESYQYKTDNDLIEWLRQYVDKLDFEQIAWKLSSLN